MYGVGRNTTGIRGTTQILVRIGKGVAIRPVTVPLPDDASITWTAPGGDDTATMTVPWTDRGIAAPDAFAHNMPVRIEDRRTGEILWQGRVADPGFSADDSGVSYYRLSCVGAGHDLDSICVLKNYMDRDLSHWTYQHTWAAGDGSTGEGAGFAAHANDAVQVPPEGNLELSLPNGSPLNLGANDRYSYLRGLYAAHDMGAEDTTSKSTGPTAVVPEVHGIRFSWMSAYVTTGNNVELLLGSAVAGSTITAYTSTWSVTTQVDVSAREGASASWTRTDIKYATIRWNRTAANTTQGQDGWLRIANIQVVGKRYNRYGVDWTASNGIEILRPYEIVEDLLGTTLAGRFDPGVITADTVLIDQASWWDATPVSEILDAANGFNAGWWWGVWAPANPDALPRLDYRPWDVAPRYTLGDDTQVELAGGAEGWANSALVSYQRANGVLSSTRVTATVPAVNRVFGSTFTRDVQVDLTDRGPMSKATAQSLGLQAIAATSTEKASGSATVNGPIIDDASGKLAQPWELRPGWPVTVVQTPNKFAAGGAINYDGVSTFRLSRVTYNASSNSATLELDGGTRSLFRGPSTKPKFSVVPQSRRRVAHN